MLRIENIEKTYHMVKDIPVLRGVSQTFDDGETVSIRGASGSGKTTLLYLMGGLDKPDAGSVWWHGEDIARWPRQRRARWRNGSVGFIFQSYYLLPELSALENVLLPAMFLRKNMEKEARVLLEQVGLANRLHHRPAELSGGEQQRVAIARALINEPDIVLADEPTGNLDEATAREVMDLLLDLIAQKRKSFVMATHDLALAKRANVQLCLTKGHLEKL